MYDKFYYSFPEKQQHFKTQFTKLFPHIYDTKHIINTSTLLMNKVDHFSELKNSFQTFKKTHHPNIRIHEAFTDYKLEKTEEQTETETVSLYSSLWHSARFRARGRFRRVDDGPYFLQDTE